MPDLTGWNPHDGSAVPDHDGEVIVLLRGTPVKGPRESGPATVGTYDWRHLPADAERNVLKDVPLGGEVIAWVPADTAAGRARYPHISPIPPANWVKPGDEH